MSFKLRVDSSRVQAIFNRMSRAHGEFGTIINVQATKTIVPAIKAQIDKNGSVFEGTLKKSIKSSIASESSKSIQVLVGSELDYARTIEEGRPAGKTFSRKEFGKLMRWVSRKLGHSPPDNMIVANRMRRSITAKGVKAKPFIRTAKDASEGKFLSRVRSDIITLVKSF
jgi:hypothetical protein